jgi:ribosomal protein S4
MGDNSIHLVARALNAIIAGQRNDSVEQATNDLLEGRIDQSVYKARLAAVLKRT